MWMSTFEFKGIKWPSREHAIIAMKMRILKGTSLHTTAKVINNYSKGTWAKSAMAQDFTNIKDHSSWHACHLETIHIIIIHATLTDHQVLRSILDPRISRFQHTLPKPKQDCFWSGENNNHGTLLQTIRHELIDFASFWHQYNLSPFTVEGYEYGTLENISNPQQSNYPYIPYLCTTSLPPTEHKRPPPWERARA